MSINCPYCNHTLEEYKITGRLGCAYCYGRIISMEEASYHSQQSKLFFKEFTFPALPLSQVLSFYKTRNISIRLRFARNLKGYPFHVRIPDQKNFLTDINNLFKDYFLFTEGQTHYQYKNLHLDLFDEDHFRFYSFPKSRTEFLLFLKMINDLDKKGIFTKEESYGFLTRCPTNSGLANKISIKIQANPAINRKVFHKNWMVNSEQAILLNEKQDLVFFLKNFNSKEAKEFLRIWFYILKG